MVCVFELNTYNYIVTNLQEIPLLLLLYGLDRLQKPVCLSDSSAPFYKEIHTLEKMGV